VFFAIAYLCALPCPNHVGATIPAHCYSFTNESSNLNGTVFTVTYLKDPKSRYRQLSNTVSIDSGRSWLGYPRSTWHNARGSYGSDCTRLLLLECDTMQLGTQLPTEVFSRFNSSWWSGLLWGITSHVIDARSQISKGRTASSVSVT